MISSEVPLIPFCVPVMYICPLIERMREKWVTWKWNHLIFCLALWWTVAIVWIQFAKHTVFKHFTKDKREQKERGKIAGVNVCHDLVSSCATIAWRQRRRYSPYLESPSGLNRFGSARSRAHCRPMHTQHFARPHQDLPLSLFNVRYWLWWSRHAHNVRVLFGRRESPWREGTSTHSDWLMPLQTYYFGAASFT